MANIKHLILLVLIIAVTSLPTFAQGVDSLNMTFYGHLQPVDSVGKHAALWGYSAPDGREYALFGSQIGTHVIDITEQPIKQVAFIWGPRNQWREMKVYKNYAYIACESHDSGSGIQIVDLSELPARVRLVRTDTTQIHSAHTLYVRDHYLLANGTQPEGQANGGTIIFDLEPDPTHPRRVGEVKPYYFHDAFMRNDTLVGAAVYGQGCDIWDVRDKANPVRLANFNYPYSGTHNAEMTTDGGYIGTSDEINFTGKTLKIWDIHDLSNITKVAEFTPNLADIIHNVHFIGRYAYIAWYTAGMRIVDMIDPLHPREVGFYDTYSGGSGSYDGVWEVYGWFKSGKVIASDRNSGLWVAKFNNATAGSVSGIVRDGATGQPLAGVTIDVPQYKRTITTGSDGAYYIGGVNGDKITLNSRLFRYGGASDQATLAGEAKQDIILQPLQMFSLTIHAKDLQGNTVQGFTYAVEPWLASQTSSNGAATVLLERDSTFTVTVGKWGYGEAHLRVPLTGDHQELTVTLPEFYQDDATLDLGWSYDAPDDMATTGRWVRIVPYLGYPNSGWIHPDQEPLRWNGHVFMTGAPPLNAAPQENDVNRGTTTLTSPRMDLTKFVHPEIRFDLWFVHYPAQDTVRDSLKIDLSNDDGHTWKTVSIDTVGRSVWRSMRFDPQNILPLTSLMKFRIRARDTLGNALVFAAMDNFFAGDNSTSAVSIPDSIIKAPDNRIALYVSPNPSRGDNTKITVGVPEPGHEIRLAIFNSVGTQVAVYDAIRSAGEHYFYVDGPLASGWYAVQLWVDGNKERTTALEVVR